MRLVSFGVGHRRCHRCFALDLQLAFDIFDQFAVLVRSQPVLHVDQIILEAGDGIAGTPVLEQLRRDVMRGVVNGVAFHAHHLGFDQRGAFAATGALAGLVGGVVDLAGVGAVDDDAGNSVRDGPLGEVFHAELHVAGSGVAPEIVLDDQNQPELLHGGKVEALVSDAGGLAAVADVSQSGDVACLAGARPGKRRP